MNFEICSTIFNEFLYAFVYFIDFHAFFNDFDDFLTIFTESIISIVFFFNLDVLFRDFHYLFLILMSFRRF